MVSSPLGGGGEDGKQKHYFPQQVLLVGDGKWGWGWDEMLCSSVAKQQIESESEKFPG
jgi:hypothetical protein